MDKIRVLKGFNSPNGGPKRGGRWGGDFAAGNFRGGIVRSGFIAQFAVGNFAPACCEPPFGWWWLLLFADALWLSPRGLLFLPDELLVSCGGLLFLLGGLLQITFAKFSCLRQCTSKRADSQPISQSGKQLVRQSVGQAGRQTETHTLGFFSGRLGFKQWGAQILSGQATIER